MESFIRFRGADGYWNDTMTRAYGEAVGGGMEGRRDQRGRMEEEQEGGEDRERRKVRNTCFTNIVS